MASRSNYRLTWKRRWRTAGVAHVLPNLPCSRGGSPEAATAQLTMQDHGDRRTATEWLMNLNPQRCVFDSASAQPAGNGASRNTAMPILAYPPWRVAMIT
jgi:hypothetical protein